MKDKRFPLWSASLILIAFAGLLWWTASKSMTWNRAELSYSEDLERVAHALIEKETLDGVSLRQLLRVSSDKSSEPLINA